ncbi:MAG TPA: prephenate dehydrogenase/arogenate dehydrogenase family protein, partial [Methylomirabilota bacterium]|nr:prephenate dehydrogenase/arogenate dehydrogenase family protein [Methylomirabilota bacterium]
MIERLAIVGVGLLGGSVAKGARAQALARRIVGIGRDLGRLRPALDDGTLDETVTDLAAGLRGADRVVLAAPVLANETLLAETWRLASPGALITDVGSTKRGIVTLAERLAAGRRDVQFVGSHPMAGSEQSGYGVARVNLFQGATVVVTPGDAGDPVAVKGVAEFWAALGARVVTLDPDTHDRAVAAISHLPHVVAWALVDAVARFEPDALGIAARGFKDTTRIAASDPDVWREILLANRAAVGASVQAFRRALDELDRLVAAGDGAALTALLARV